MIICKFCVFKIHIKMTEFNRLSKTQTKVTYNVSGKQKESRKEITLYQLTIYNN